MEAKTKELIIKKLSAPLSVRDIEFRIQSISEKGWATILAYKDARVDMNRLDQVCGTNWQRRHVVHLNNLFCQIGILIEGKEWVWREDVGVPSHAEKEKGQASDSFKRAGFNWGIGRELYDYPLIFLQLKGGEFTTTEFGGKKTTKATYNLHLRDWTWQKNTDEAGDIQLVGADELGKLRYNSSRKKFDNTPSDSLPPLISQTRIDMLKALVAKGRDPKKLIASLKKRFLIINAVEEDILNTKKN